VVKVELSNVLEALLSPAEHFARLVLAATGRQANDTQGDVMISPSQQMAAEQCPLYLFHKHVSRLACDSGR
jgi:hypothetical protein